MGSTLFSKRKFAANRMLTLVENMVLSQKLSEYHTGLRAFSRPLLAAIPFQRNSDDFVFDNQIIAQALAVGARIGELSCPTRYQADSSSINLMSSVRYGLGVLRTCAEYRLHRSGVRRYSYLDIDRAAHLSILPRLPARPSPRLRTASPRTASRSGPRGRRRSG